MDSKSILDAIHKEIFTSLKPQGFKKKGRTFNRKTEEGITQVINFQTGQYPVGDSYVIPGLRENLYGKFTVNLGVCVDDLCILSFPYQTKEFYQEYDCQFRQRLAQLTKEQDYWWPLTVNCQKVIEDILQNINAAGLAWLNQFATREEIKANWTQNGSPRAKLDFGIIMLKTDKESGQKIIQEYVDELGPSKNDHKKYVIDLAKELGLTLHKTSA